MFLFKKIFSQFLFPLPLTLGISFFGLYLLWFTRKQKLGKIIISFALITLTFFSYGVISDHLLGPLENRYDPYSASVAHGVYSSENTIPIKYVVVLGGGHTSDETIPVTSQINGSSLVRLIEGIRIYRKHKGSKLLLSGGRGFDPVPNAEVMARVAREIGIDEGDIILETSSKDTREEARFIEPVVGSDPFVMVTSASHMPRAMALFEKLEMNPIPAPTGHRVKRSQGLAPGFFFPGAGNLHNSQKALYEYLGTAWARLRGQI